MIGEVPEGFVRQPVVAFAMCDIRVPTVPTLRLQATFQGASCNPTIQSRLNVHLKMLNGRFKQIHTCVATPSPWRQFRAGVSKGECFPAPHLYSPLSYHKRHATSDISFGPCVTAAAPSVATGAAEQAWPLVQQQQQQLVLLVGI